VGGSLARQVTVARFEQPENAVSPMLPSSSGRLMDFREEQPKNALSPILFSDVERLMEVRTEQ